MGKFIENLKDALHTRVNEKTGTYYIKGKKAHQGEENPFSGLSDYSSDPDLSDKKDDLASKTVRRSRHLEHR
jgi:hypothetical protein